jgi:Na+-translocating ferredoxin:NAD+ oxidoreductase subunit C
MSNHIFRGVKLDQKKEPAILRPISAVDLPYKVVIPLSQKWGSTAIPMVTPGMKVVKYQQIAAPENDNGCYILSPVCGTVRDFEEIYHPSLGKTSAIAIDAFSKRDARERTFVIPELNPESISPDDIIEYAKLSGIIDSLSGKPLNTILSEMRENGVDIIAASALDDQSYISSRLRLFADYPKWAAEGLKLIMKASHVENGVIGVYHCFETSQLQFPQKIDDIKVITVTGAYPAIFRLVQKASDIIEHKKLRGVSIFKRLINATKLVSKQPSTTAPVKKNSTGNPFFDISKEIVNIPARITGQIGGIFEAYNKQVQKTRVGLIDIETCIALYNSIYTRTPPSTCVVTVAGDCVGNPLNVEVLYGTPISSVLSFCGLIHEPDTIILGSIMNGVFIEDPQTPVLPGTTAILAMRRNLKRKQQDCFNCGRCTQVCPSGLMPSRILKYSSQEMIDDCLEWGALKCIRCGCCSYVCPANVDVMAYVASAQKEIIQNASQMMNDMNDKGNNDKANEEEAK